MIKFIKKQYSRYKEQILYLFFGAATTVINTICYAMLYQHLGNLISTVIAWVLAVVFAFITNKAFVFKSRSMQAREIIKEAVSFFGCRILTGVLDVAIMVVAVNILLWNNVLWKLISNILVILLNYFISKLVIFKAGTNSR